MAYRKIRGYLSPRISRTFQPNTWLISIHIRWFLREANEVFHLLERSDVRDHCHVQTLQQGQSSILGVNYLNTLETDGLMLFEALKKDCFEKLLFCLMCYILAKMQTGFSFLSAK